MTSSGVVLAPFASPAPAVELRGWLAIDPAQGDGPPWLRLRFSLRNLPGQRGLEQLLLPAPARIDAAETGGGERRDGLWEHTCLECFLAPAGAAGYREFNLAPDGSWNVYSLEDYRQGLRPDATYAQLPFRCGRRADGLELALHCPLPADWADQERFDWQLSAVLEQQDGQLSYWALRHPVAAADFHDRSCWTLASCLSDDG